VDCVKMKPLREDFFRRNISLDFPWIVTIRINRFLLDRSQFKRNWAKNFPVEILLILFTCLLD
jgi:hypothetical protein